MFKRAIIKLIKLVTRQKSQLFFRHKRVTCILKVPEVAASSIDGGQLVALTGFAGWWQV